MDAAAILASGRAALPLVDDPFAALAAGFRISRSDLTRLLRDSEQAGDLLGVWAEVNPVCETWRELLAESPVPEGPLVRWRAGAPNGGSVSSVLLVSHLPGLPGARPAVEVHKCGFPCAARAPLEPTTDRTYLVEGPPAVEPDHPGPITLLDALARGHRPDYGANLWEELVPLWGYGAAQAQRTMRDLLMGKVVRRFALRTSMRAWLGCGLAEWTLDPAAAPRAAAALARLSGTGDVCVRAGGVVSALFLGREPGSGEAAAREVARQWGAPLGRFVELRFAA